MFNTNNELSGCNSCSLSSSRGDLKRLGIKFSRWDHVVALAGNPNTGKSTLFNSLTGLRQHTGNWTGKTVSRAEGGFAFKNRKFKLIDLPGTYSLLSSSEDEIIARDFILNGNPDVTIIVVDAARLERNLNLVLQILEITSKVIVCLNLMDEAEQNGYHINVQRLSDHLQVPVIPTVARNGKGITTLLNKVNDIANSTSVRPKTVIQYQDWQIAEAINVVSKKIQYHFPHLKNSRWIALRLIDGDQQEKNTLIKGLEIDTDHEIFKLADQFKLSLNDKLHDGIVESIYIQAHQIAKEVVYKKDENKNHGFGGWLDKIVLHRVFGFPVMFFLFALMFWITISAANIPSGWLYHLLIDTAYPAIKELFISWHFPWWLTGLLADGMYLATAWVVSVMLPPMAIFFPLFTLLEDLGYLPRVAFNLDGIFKKAGAHGKQSMTMMMGFGCNAAGVIATRIIDSPRERLIAIITNNFALCNGRWPTQILVASLFIGTLVSSHWAGIITSMAVVGVALFGIFITFMVSGILSRTVLKGESSVFSLELPPYRKPHLWQILYRSLIDRTLFVLWRAVVFALPAGAVIWLISNINVSSITVAEHIINLLDPAGIFLGLNGVILLAYIVAIPANEIVIPTILMLIVLVTGLEGMGEGAGVIFETDSSKSLMTIFSAGGWTTLTAVNLMVFSLLHNPCSTTLYTIYKETKSWKWTIISAIIPVITGIIAIFIITQMWRIF